MIRTRKLLPGAIMTLIMLLTLLTGCNREEDKSKYDYLKTDIVGAWCDETGPEVVETNMGSAARFYEFTNDGSMYHYYAYADMGAIYYEYEYSIDGNLFSSDGAMCRINVEDNILTMTTDAGTSRYRRVGAAELLEYDVYAHGEALYAEQEPMIMSEMAENGGAEGNAGDVNASPAETSETAESASAE